MFFGDEQKIRRESVIFFSANISSVLAMNLRFKGVSVLPSRSGAMRKNMTRHFSAATTSTISGVFKNAYVSAKTRPCETLSKMPTLPQTSTFSILTLPCKTTPNSGVTSPESNIKSSLSYSTSRACPTRSNSANSKSVSPAKSLLPIFSIKKPQFRGYNHRLSREIIL